MTVEAMSAYAGINSSDDVSEAARLRPRVGITGSFGRGNYGDELYIKTYEHWFGGWADLHLLSGLPSPVYLRHYGDAYVDLMDAVVLGGGDLIVPYVPRVSRDFINPSYLRKSLHVVGIGVQLNRSEIDPSVLGRWRNFLQHSSVASISMRDPESRDWVVEHIGPRIEVSSHADLVCALPLPRVSAPEGAPVVGVVTRHVQPGDNYRQLEEILRDMRNRGWRIRHIIGGVGPHGKKDFANSELLDVPGKEVVYSENLDDISVALGECSLVLSMKLHTTVVATMYGIPTVCVNPVVKARQFMRMAGAEEFVIGPLDPKLKKLIDAGIPEPSREAVKSLKMGAEAALRGVGQNIWNDFRVGSSLRELLPDIPRWPGSAG